MFLQGNGRCRILDIEIILCASTTALISIQLFKLAAVMWRWEALLLMLLLNRELRVTELHDTTDRVIRATCGRRRLLLALEAV